MRKRVLVLAPHPDDEVIGCGGAILLHRQQGDQVEVVFLTSGERGNPETPPEELRALREMEAAEAARVLDVNRIHFLRLPDQGIAVSLDRGAILLRQFLQTADVVYLPHRDEEHPDHAATNQLLCQARVGAIPLRGYEVWTPLGRPDLFCDITAVMHRKLQALRCYQSQLALVRYDQAIRGLNRYRGAMTGGGYKEAFAV